MAEAVRKQAPRDRSVDRALSPCRNSVAAGVPAGPSAASENCGSVLGARLRDIDVMAGARLAKPSAVPVTHGSRSHCRARWDDTDDTKLSHGDIRPIHQPANIAALGDPPDAH